MKVLEYTLSSTQLGFALTKVFGIGIARGYYICSLVGLGRSVHIKSLNQFFKESIRAILLRYSYRIGEILYLDLVLKLEFYINY